MESLGPVCECCEKRTLEPIYHADTGDAFCGGCAVELLDGEVKVLRAALAELVRLKDGPRDDAYRAAKDAAWEAGRAALALREDQRA